MDKIPDVLQDIIKKHISLSAEKAFLTRNATPKTKAQVKDIFDAIDVKIESLVNEVDWQGLLREDVVIEIRDKADGSVTVN